MDSKTIISNFRNALKNKTLDAHAFNELCQVLKSQSTEEEVIKIFSETTISNIVRLYQYEIICIMGSFLWDASIDLWGKFVKICKENSRFRDYNEHQKFFNEIIKHGDSKMFVLAQELRTCVEVYGDSYRKGSGDIDAKISPEFAKKIASYPGKIKLKVFTISVEVAKILSRKKGDIDITMLFNEDQWKGKTPKWDDYRDFFVNVVYQSDGYISFAARGIDYKLAAILGSASGKLYLPGITHLTVGVAKGLAAHNSAPGSEGLEIGGSRHGSLKCEPGALQEFAGHKGRLTIGGVIPEITFEDAKALACHEGDLVITLSNMPELKTLEELLKIKDRINLNITKHPTKSYHPPLTPDLAEIIANYQGKELNFEYFGEVPDESAKKLAKLRSRLTIEANLNDEARDKLKEAGVRIFYYSSNKDLMAQVLDLNKVVRFLEDKDSVNLSNMTTITEDAVVEALANYKGDLDLSGLTQLPDSALKDLSKHQGGGLGLNGLRDLSDSAVKELSKHRGALWLSGLTELSDAAAEALSKHEGFLILDGLANLSDVAAEALSKHQGGLTLNGLTELSDAAAEALSKLEGPLRFWGLTELSDAAAESLSKHQGDLWLSGLTQLSAAVAESLSKHQGSLFLQNVSGLSDAAAAALIKHQGKIDSQEPADWVDWKMKHSAWI